MYCKNCGFEIDDNAKFCSSCGTKQSIKSNSYRKKAPVINIDTVSSSEKDKIYDLSHKTSRAPLRLAIIVLIIWILLSILVYTNYLDSIALDMMIFYENAKTLAVNVTFILRVVSMAFCISYSQKLNRSKLSWGVLGFFFPIITLTLLGFSKKIKAIPLSDLSNTDKSKYFNQQAWKSIDTNTRKAIKLSSKAISLDPENHYAYYTRSLAYFTLKEYDKSLKDIEKSISINNTSAKRFYRRGNVYLALNQNEKACQDWHKAKKLGFVDAEDMISQYCE